MRILYVLSNISFPPMEGAHEQTLRVIKGMADRGHRCVVVTFVTSRKNFDEKAFKDYAPNVEILDVLTNRRSYTSTLLINTLISSRGNFFFSRHAIGKVLASSSDRMFETVMDEASARFEIIHAEGIPLAPVLKASKPIPVVFSTVDAWSMRQKRLFLAAKTVKERVLRLISYGIAVFAERTYLKRFKYVHVVSESDAEYLRGETRLESIVAIPVSLPIDVKISNEAASTSRGREIVVSGDIRVSYVMDGICDFLEAAVPRMTSEFADTTFRVLSRAPAFGRLGEIVGRWPAQIRVEAWVQDFAATLAGASVIVLPDASGSGLKNRTVVAMASGRPVVGTTWAFEGVGMRNWREGVSSKTTVGLVDGVVACLRKPSFANRIGRKGARHASENFRLESVLTRWEHLYADAAA